MNEEETPNNHSSAAFESLDILIHKFRDGTFREIIDDWKWIFTYTVRYKKAVVFYLILGLLSTTLGLISTVISGKLIDIVTGHRVGDLWFLVLLMVGSSVFSLTFNSIINRISTKLGIFINNDIQGDIFDKIIDADWMEINKYSNGDVLNRFNGDISSVSGNAISWIPTVVISIYQFIATFIVMLKSDIGMAIIAFISAPFMLIVSKFVIKKQRDYNKKVREMSSEMMSFEVETFYNFDSIKSFGIAHHYSKKLRWWQEKFKNISLIYNLFSIKTNVYMSSVGMCIGFLAFFYCLARLWGWNGIDFPWVHNQTFTYGMMTQLLAQRGQLSSAFSSLVGLVPGFLQSSVSAHRVRELVQLPKEVHIPESSKMDAWVKDGFTVEMRDADFAYVKDNKVIRDSSMIAKPGEIVALIGPSGEGKTTIIRLILGLIHPQKGEVVLRASNGMEIPMNVETRHLFAYVPQGNTILSGTIAENMRMVVPDATDEQIINALKISCAWDFIKDFPDTINHKIGERGRGFSEGQAQRISIARAILRDSPILLLDEATSALDVTTERKVLRNIVSQQPNKTCIVTTHRPSVLNLSQRVYRVMDRKVTELDEESSSKMAMDF